MNEQLKDKQILVVYGGPGNEREISLRTGRAIYDTLVSGGYGDNVEEFILDKDNARELLSYRPDICFVAVHGKFGEDGVIQGFLEFLGIPYTGSGVTSSALAMDKGLSKIIFEANNIPTPKYYFGGGAEPEFIPCVVKPAREGSTIGISIVRNAEDYSAAILEAKKYDDHVLVEEFIEGKEFTVSMINGELLPIIHIRPNSGFYDYTSKYTKGATQYLFDTGLNDAETALVNTAALNAYKALGCKGVARADVIFANGIPYVLEVNTMPGMTETSLVPKAAKQAGMTFLELVEKMLAGAIS